MTSIDYRIETGGTAEHHPDEIGRPGELDHVRPLPRISEHAFCETEAMLQVMERCAHDRRMGKVSVRINSGTIAAAANMFASAPTPNLIILETATEPHALMNELAPLAEVCDPSTKVVIIGRHNDISLYRDLIRKLQTPTKSNRTFPHREIKSKKDNTLKKGRSRSQSRPPSPEEKVMTPESKPAIDAAVAIDAGRKRRKKNTVAVKNTQKTLFRR